MNSKVVDASGPEPSGFEPVSDTAFSSSHVSPLGKSSDEGMNLGRAPCAMLAWSHTQGAGFLGGAPLEWLTEDGSWAAKSPEGTDVNEWRQVMLTTTADWPLTAPDMGILHAPSSFICARRGSNLSPLLCMES
jgi:hypothetical protein